MGTVFLDCNTLWLWFLALEKTVGQRIRIRVETLNMAEYGMENSIDSASLQDVDASTEIRCQRCGFTCQQKLRMLDHTTKCHGENPKMTPIKNIETETFREKISGELQCHSCNFKSYYKHHMTKHIAKHHCEQYSDLEVIAESPKFEERNGVMDQNRNVMEHECKDCGEKFDSSTEFDIHFAHFHTLTRENCNVCGKQFNTIHSLCLHTGNEHLEETVEYVKKYILK